MLSQGLKQKLLQKLSPQQIQLIKLLEIPTVMLEQRIKKELEENPALEEGQEGELQEKDNISSEIEESGDEAAIYNSDDSITDNPEEIQGKDDFDEEFTIEDFLNQDEYSLYDYSMQYSSKDSERKEMPLPITKTFHEYLENQLGFKILTEKQRIIGCYIIGNIDDDGYLRRDLESIVDDIAFLQNIEISEQEVAEVLQMVQSLDPPGVGARNLQECLLLQIHKKKSSKYQYYAIRILTEFFDEFTKKHYNKIAEKLGIDTEELKKVIAEILKLNPKPGSAFTDSFQTTDRQYQIIPDFILENTDGNLELSLNAKNIPELRISSTYENILDDYRRHRHHTKKQKETIAFVKQKLAAARWFIKAIKQRQNTLLLTMNAIIDYQKEFFLTGDEKKLKPMILRNIAEKTGLDVSTISRVASSKYIQTDFGIYPLKYFFSEGTQTVSGEEVSTREIKKNLQICIENEDKRHPLTDEELTKILREKGYKIARRTVAKYREQLNIPVARLRKEI